VTLIGTGSIALSCKSDRFSSSRAEPRNTFLRPEYSACRHFSAGDLLDLTGGARSIIDKDTLAQP
jgi:hypothetical protein